jgi:putative ABC transport system permease protein
MARIPGVRPVFRLPSSEGRVAGEVRDEIEFHLEERVRDLSARGMNPDAARAEALREFGNVSEAQEELEEIGRRRVRSEARTGWWSDLRQDVRYGLRALFRSPGFTIVAVLTLALGIGATTAIYTVVDTVLLRPLGMVDAERLVVLRERAADAEEPPRGGGTVSPANFFDWEAQARSFSSMAYFVQRPLNLTGDGEPQQVQVQMTSADFFPTLGVQPVLGRGFRPDEDQPGSENLNFGKVTVISHALWQNRYGGDPAILGKTIQVAGDPFEVVGVMGPDVRVMDQKPDLWIPVGIVRGNRTTMGRFITGVARLKPGVTFETAQQEMNVITRRLQQAYPGFNTDMGIDMITMREQVVGEVRPALLVLLAAVAVLLLIACTNVANLLLGRASARRQEIAVRLSLGATRGRLVRQLLTESLVLSLVGGLIGVAAAAVGTRALVRSLPESVQIPRMDVVSIDGRVVAVALGVTLLTGILFGLAPALVSSRADLQSALRDAGGRSNTSGKAPMRLRSALVISEVALALMLLVSAGLLLRSFQKLQAVETGLRPEGVLTMRLEIRDELFDGKGGAINFLAQLLSGMEGLPGVQSVGTVSHLPLTEGKTGHTAYRPDRPKPEPGQEPSVDIRVVGGDYFAAQGVRLIRGRAFDERDNAGSGATFVINEALAREQFPNEDPVGKRFAYPWPDLIEGEIIGVVADVRETSITDEPAQALYRTFTQWPGPTVNLVIRTSGDPMAIARAAQDQVHRIDPDLPVAGVRSMESVVAEATARPRMSSYLLGGFAGMALLLAAIGLYGVISYGVAQRRGEIGVRMALGAHRGAITGLIVRQGMVLTAAGLVVGLVGAFALTRLLRSLLFGVTAVDPITFLAVPLVLAAAALLASYLPANRAARTDPAVVLRAQ